MGYEGYHLRRISTNQSRNAATSTMTMTIVMLTDELEAAVKECLDYGALRGLGQWRNSGKGRFAWEEVC